MKTRLSLDGRWDQYLIEDCRIGGQKRYVFSSNPKLMRVPAEVRKCVAFIGLKDSIGQFKPGGTVFFVGKKIEGTESNFFYAVTAKHVLDGLKRREDEHRKMAIRFNLKNDQAYAIEVPSDRWFFHPEEGKVENETVEVALISINLPDQMDHLVLPLDMMATEKRIEEEKIGVGDEVFLTGLFVRHPGRRKNIPIVRAGNIAAMPEEKIYTAVGWMDAYLVEARSMGGLSGSPVFVHLGVARKKDGELKISNADYGIFYLLGVMQGHWDLPSELEEDFIKDDLAVDGGGVNMGIGVVIPIQKVLEAINQPMIREKEKITEEEIRQKRLPKLDIAIDSEPLSKEQFTDVLKKVSRKLE